MGIPTLRTERLVLQEPTRADAPAVLVFRGDPRVQRFNGTRREYSLEDDLAFHDGAVYGLLSSDR